MCLETHFTTDCSDSHGANIDPPIVSLPETKTAVRARRGTRSSNKTKAGVGMLYFLR